MTKFRTQKDEVFPVIPSDMSEAHRSFFEDVLSVMSRAIRNTRLDLDTITIEKWPVGSFYIQFANADSNTTATAFPDAYAPTALFGGTWVKQWDTEGIFFKTEGDPLTQTNGELNNRTTGLQTDMMQGFKYRSPYSSVSGPLYNLPNPPQSQYSNLAYPESDGTNGTPRMGKETRGRNRLIRVWKRTA